MTPSPSPLRDLSCRRVLVHDGHPHRQLSNVAVYAFIHSDLSQVEQVAAMLTDVAHGRVFLYSFNTAFARVQRYFSTFGPHVSVATMSLTSVVDAVREDGRAGRRVVMLTPASPNYEFGSEQLRVLSAVKTRFPNVVADVFSVGHCLFG